MMETPARIDATTKMEEWVASLHHLLEEELAAGRGGNFSRMAQLGELANAVVARIVEQGGSVSAVMEPHRPELERLYGELALMLGAEQADVQGKLKRLRRVKRAVNAYRTDR